MPPPIDLAFFEGFDDLVDLPIIREAAESLMRRDLLTPSEFRALVDEAKATAFTVAGVEELTVLDKIRNALAETVDVGLTLQEFSKKVEDEVGAGTFLSPGHQETVFRTNVQSAYSDGLRKILDKPLVGDAFPYVAYHAIHDDRVREEHLGLERYGLDGGNVYRRDDSVIIKFWAPWDFNCRCGMNPMTVAQAARAGVKEAIEWERTGRPPIAPQFVEHPPFEPPEGFRRTVSLSTLLLMRLGWVEGNYTGSRASLAS